MAIMAGYAVSRIPSKFYGILLIAIAREGIINQQHDFFIRPSQAYKLSLEEIADSVSNKKDLILINDNGSPQMLYFSHRKGWSVHNEILTDQQKVQSYIEKGARYIIVDKKNFPVPLQYPEVFTDGNFTVYKLITPGQP
jgi:hypothetical protein